MTSAERRHQELVRRYQEQSREWHELRAEMERLSPDNPPTPYIVSLAQRKLREQRGQPLLTNVELNELYDGLPDDSREPGVRTVPRAAWWVRAWRAVFGQSALRGGPWE